MEARPSRPFNSPPAVETPVTLRPLSREEVRSIDARAIDEFHIPSLVLMENAGRGATDWLSPQVPARGKVLVLCGSGNNGGDGAVVARHLDARGVDVAVRWLAAPERLSPDARAQQQILAAARINQCVLPTPLDPEPIARELASAAWLVDALLGTGLVRPVEGALKLLIDLINASRVPTLALDLPSGLDADLGQPLGAAVRAYATVTFVAPKIGFAVPGAADYTGSVHVADIGVPRAVLEPFVIPSTRT